MWSKFDPRCISIGASLDASNERGEYIPKELYGVKLLKTECVQKKNVPDIDFNISCTVSMFNVLNVVDL